MASRQKRYRPATELVHGGTLRSQFAETSEAMFLTQGFVYPDAEAAEARFKGEDPGFVYSRYANPTVSMFEERMCLLEGAEASRAMASGMAAVTAAFLLPAQGRRPRRVVARAVRLLPVCHRRFPAALRRVLHAGRRHRPRRLAEGGAAGDARLLPRKPVQPDLELIDIAAVAEIADEAGARLIVDNVFSTPLFQKPLELGAHVVVYSATKHIDGQGRCLGGIVLSDEKWVEEKLFPYLKHTGPSLSPFNAWVLLKALETLEIRVTRQAESAAKLAEMLADHPAVERLYYPGHASHPQFELARRQMTSPGTMISFDIRGGKRAAFDFSRALESDQNLQQSRRCEEPGHPPRDDDASAAEGGGAGGARHRRRADPAVGRPGGPRGPRRRSSECARPRRGAARPRRLALKHGPCCRR